MKYRTMVPFLKWVGGKRQALKEIEKVWPKKFNTYYEPFLGGGAVLFHFKPSKAIINDTNEELINLYNVISKKSSYKRFREYLLLMEYGHHVFRCFDEKKQEMVPTSPFYKQIASIDRNPKNTDRLLSLEKATKELKAARFLFLNKNSFNGLYRVNSEGHYNTPSKHKATKTFDEDNIKQITDYLYSSTKIFAGDYKEAIKTAKKGDFVYFDPPYDYEKGTVGFDAYSKDSFGVQGQIELANVCKALDKKGVKFLLSNHNTKLIKSLYKDFNIKVIKIRRLVGGKGAQRKKVEEVLVRNYE